MSTFATNGIQMEFKWKLTLTWTLVLQTSKPNGPLIEDKCVTFDGQISNKLAKLWTQTMYGV